MRKDTRDRLVLPILLPIGLLVVLAAVLFGFSRILLSLPHTAATATALVVAFSIVVVSALAATRTAIRASSLAAMIGAIAGVAMLAGGIALATARPEAAGEAGGPSTVVDLVAKSLQFQPTSLSVPAGQRFGIAFDNQDAGVQHNVVIFDNKDFSGTPLYRGELVTGPKAFAYTVPSLAPGTYYFHCEIHPTMTGTITATAGGASGGPSPGGGGASPSTVTAEGIQFDTNQISLPANTAVPLTFDNKDAGVQHNIAIYTDSSLATNLFKGELVMGPATVTYRVPPLPPGTYYFHCDVHPPMNGTVTVG